MKTRNFISEKRATLREFAAQLRKMSETAEMLACEIPVELDAEYSANGYHSEFDDVNYVWTFLSEARDDLGATAQIVEDALARLDEAEERCDAFAETVAWYLRGDEFTELRDVHSERKNAEEWLVAAGLSKSDAAAHIAAIERDAKKHSPGNFIIVGDAFEG